ncbi:hypothetical protein PTTG_25437 [Puccinia triticina 1-1 BBBD Race 1]|uniref:CCHC-type domain-containing protein n=1 Tax=Puccinia triticina (isolate 1-1 / race 1 (BBBD)) TaxID=630390 RepID=A0A180H1Z0_PUCT1|nr:hypothetical protein PTTG_25437 [Puccinia triticina 1-1 BBBD Race 1]
MSNFRQVHNIAAMLSLIATLDGTEAVFPQWRDRLEGMLGMQNTLDIVKGSLTRPKEDTKVDTSGIWSADFSKGYNPKEIAADWDSLLDLACHTIRLTLSNPLSQRYRKVKPAPRLYSTIVKAYKKNTRTRRMHLHEAFWNARHDPNKPIALWIGHIWVAADDLLTVEELPTDQQITNRLVAGLNPSWSNVRDTIVYTATEMSLDDVVGAMEAHEVSLNGNKSTDLTSVSAAYTKRVACSNCGKQGHPSNECPKPKNFGKTKAGAAVELLPCQAVGRASRGWVLLSCPRGGPANETRIRT